MCTCFLGLLCRMSMQKCHIQSLINPSLSFMSTMQYVQISYGLLITLADFLGHKFWNLLTGISILPTSLLTVMPLLRVSDFGILAWVPDFIHPFLRTLLKTRSFILKLLVSCVPYCTLLLLAFPSINSSSTPITWIQYKCSTHSQLSLHTTRF